MTRRAEITLGRLHLPSPSQHGAQSFAREVARELREALPAAGVTGNIPRIHLSLTAEDARDPKAVTRAVVRALKDGGEGAR